jgi:hypothetical protein
MIITQTIKGWLQKLFAWWPWKQSTPIESQHVASVAAHRPGPENTPRSRGEYAVPQPDSVSRLSTLEDQSTARPFVDACDSPPLPALLYGSSKEHLPASGPGEASFTTPTTRQRLEFLRYLVQHGLLNEELEQKNNDS